MRGQLLIPTVRATHTRTNVLGRYSIRRSGTRSIQHGYVFISFAFAICTAILRSSTSYTWPLKSTRSRYFGEHIQQPHGRNFTRMQVRILRLQNAIRVQLYSSILFRQFKVTLTLGNENSGKLPCVRSIFFKTFFFVEGDCLSWFSRNTRVRIFRQHSANRFSINN